MQSKNKFLIAEEKMMHKLEIQKNEGLKNEIQESTKA